jgi:alkaline phosphatase D
MLTRRLFLTSVLAAPVVFSASRAVRSRADFPLSADYGVASGEPRPDSVVIWTRVPEWSQPAGGEAVTGIYEVSTSPAFDTLAVQGHFVTDGATDYTVKVTIGGLWPSTRYYYRFSTVTGYHSVVGRTQTAPAPDTEPAVITFAFVSCQNYTEGFYTVYAHLAQEDLDFCVHLGDNIYETSSSVGGPLGRVRDDFIGGGEAMTLAEYRQKYQLYLSDPYLREVRRRFPWVVLWDDHEVRNNYAGTVMSVEDPQRLRDAYTAFLEYMPLQAEISGTSRATFQDQLYRQFSFGRLLDIFALDERQYRDGPACTREFVVFGCPELDDPTRTMLGVAQRRWLASRLAHSAARWKCLLNQVMMMRLGVTSRDLSATQGLLPHMLPMPFLTERGFYINLDAWDGYPAERSALLQLIGDQQIRNVVVCTGDLHNCYAGVLRPNFDDPTSPPVAVEIVGASITSDGLTELVGQDLTLLGRTLVRRTNPHIVYLDLKYHVYSKVVVTPEQLQVRYMAVNTILQPISPVFLLNQFTVLDGLPMLL